MSSSLALLVCVAGIAGLFFLDRDNSLQTSKALWLPVIWLWIVGSRPVSVWLGMNPATADTAMQVEGSPFDAGIFGVLLAAGILVLISRRRQSGAYLKACWPVTVYFAYCLLSVLWSDFPDIAFKRWIKAIGDLVMVLVLVTDAEPVPALKRLFSRVGFILFPASVLLIRYYGDLGRGYDPDGRPMNTGVTTNKNTLGVITFIIALGALWAFLTFLRAKGQPDRGRHLLAQSILLAFGVALLVLADSATSVACFALGAVLILATYLPWIRRRPVRVHALVLMILLVGGLTMLFGGQTGVVHALGRQTSLTGRTEIWAAVLPVVPSAFVGAGFESFWLPGPRLERVYSQLSQYMHVNEAHNGYIEVYLNLGWIGVGLIAIILISGYRGAVAAFRRNPTLGGLMLAYVAAAAIYSISEAGFRMLNPIWLFLLLALVGSRGIVSGTGARAKPHLRPGALRTEMLPAGHAIAGRQG
jgi:exopolysaccharide production protein ExoQ